MAKPNKQKQQPPPAAKKPQPVAKQPQPKKAVDKNNSDKKKFLETKQAPYIIGGIIAIICYLFNKACLGNQFTNWDDPGYILSDPYIKNFSGDGIKQIFSLDTYVMGNYHPLTILSYAWEYAKAGLDPWQYHFDSLMLYVVDTLMVYWLALKLSKNILVAAIAGLLFGLHPMHVESVAWAAGRKDLLYAIFFIGACITYLNYQRNDKGKAKNYTLTLLLFICALLAKPVAVTLPPTLLLLDYLEGRKWTKATILQQLPFFALSVVFGIISIKAQDYSGALMTQNETYNVLQRILLGFYALFTYLWKAVIPVNLSNFYPYPPKTNGQLPAILYAYAAIIIALGLAIWKFAGKNRLVIFAVLFFIVNIALLLQFIPVGGAIVADRYAFVPYIGFMYVAAWYVVKFYQQNAQAGKLLLGGTLIYCLALGYLSSERCTVWYDTITMWRDNIEKNGVEAPNAYNNLGFEYYKRAETAPDANQRKLYYDSSIYLLTQATIIQPDFVNPYTNLGDIYRSLGQNDKALQSLNKALQLDPKDSKPWLAKAIVLSIMQRLDSAGYCFRQTLALKPFSPEAHSSYGNYLDMTGKPDSAIAEYTVAINENPDLADGYLNRGNAYQRANNCDKAMQDYNHIIAIQPNHGAAYYMRSFCELKGGNKQAALQDVNKSISLGYGGVDQAYYQGLKN